MSRKVYQHVGGLNPRRSVFSNSHYVITDMDMGTLVPMMLMECVPGDIHKLGMEAVIRFHPLVAPVLHDIYYRTFTFFVPMRLIMNEETKEKYGDNGTWEDFITGGRDGNDATTLPLLYNEGTSYNNWQGFGYSRNTLSDYFGLPRSEVNGQYIKPTLDSMPISLPFRAYNLIYNEYFRDQNLEEEIPLDKKDENGETLENGAFDVRRIAWQKDRFTAGAYDIQRGDRPAIPLQGLTSVNFNGVIGNTSNLYPIGMSDGDTSYPVLRQAFDPMNNSNKAKINMSSGNPILDSGIPSMDPATRFRDWLNQNSLNMSQAVTFDTVDMRRLFQLQKYLERNMRVGARYAEQIPARFGVRPQDYRLQRPEFIGATRSPIIVSEVLQTSESSNESKQGNLAGHGISAEYTNIGTCRCYEHGYLITLATVQPRALYVQGIHKFWQRRTKFDFLTPELVNLSEVAVKNSELVITGNSRDDQIFNYQGIYDEYRMRESYITGNMRSELDYWHLAREDYNSTHPPSFNKNFVICNPSKRIFAVQNVPGVIVMHGNRIRSVRPLPIIAEPGLIDHH